MCVPSLMHGRQIHADEVRRRHPCNDTSRLNIYLSLVTNFSFFHVYTRIAGQIAKAPFG